jgi:23S rRNA (uridine2552-2'-O)-methyltransferase
MTNQRRYQDHYGRRAKAEGRPARSVFKLAEIDQRWRILRPGDHVLDLGAAPGSWIQYAAEKVGPAGSVVGYDLTPIGIGLPAHAKTIVADVFALDTDELAGPFDVVLSDMAPSTMGDHHTDAARSEALVERALDLADRHLRRGGIVVTKVLEGAGMPAIVLRMRQAYVRVERLRPDATRRHSTEIFLIGLKKNLPPIAAGNQRLVQ